MNSGSETEGEAKVGRVKVEGCVTKFGSKFKVHCM